MDQKQRLEWFREARIGIFLHWGLYSVLGRNEWSIFLDQMPLAEYEKLADRFVPDNFDADAWASFAAESGVKYMILTTRHHDGFCLFDSKFSDFTSVKRAAKRDFVAEYAEALRKAGVKVGFYYSLADWRYKGAWNADEYPESAARMVEQCHAQLKELMSNYGKVDILWYDGNEWNGEASVADAWRSKELNAMARDLQPHLLINDRSGLDEDFGTPERKIEASKVESRHWESCLQMDSIGWGYIPHSPNLKSAARIVADISEIAAGGGNLLLNTGPQPDGRIRPAEEAAIREAGAWLMRNGQAIYGSRRSCLPSGPMSTTNRHAWWLGTSDPCVHHLVALCWMGREFFTVRVDGEVKDVSLMPGGTPVSFTRGPRGRLTFTGLPEAPPDPLGTIFRVTFAEPPGEMELLKDGSWLQADL